MMEELLREHGANGTTLIVCLVAGWRWLQSALNANHDRTTAIRDAVGAVEQVARALGGAALVCEKIDKLNRNAERTSDTTAGLHPP